MRYHLLTRPALLLCLPLLALVLSSCEAEKENQIAWQLPLEAPSDPHAAVGHDLPEWAAASDGAADIYFLNKRTTKVTKISLEKMRPVEWKQWKVSLLGVAEGLQVKEGAFIDEKSVHNAAAFVELISDNRVIYRGWLYQEFPELFGLENPVWKVWVSDVIVRTPQEEVDPYSADRLP